MANAIAHHAPKKKAKGQRLPSIPPGPSGKRIPHAMIINLLMR
jgi:hypothetical protein